MLVVFALVSAVWAAPAAGQPQVVESVEVDGNLRVEDAAVLGRARFTEGQAIDPRMLGNAIRSIYELGLFNDIRIDARPGTTGYILTIVVVEKPAVGSIRFDGIDELSEEDLTEVLVFQVQAVLDENAVRRSERAIVDLYREKGFYLAEVRSEIVPRGAGEVEVVFSIREQAKVKVSRVAFVGNQTLSAEDLQAVMMTREGGLLDFLTSHGTFQRENFQADVQRIMYLYYDSGYLDVSVGDPLVTLSRDRNEIYVTIPIVEGEPYDVLDVSVSGDLLASQQELVSSSRLPPGERLRMSTVREDIERLTLRYKDAGYANVNIDFLPQANRETRQVSVQYDITQGEVCSIGRITFAGNTLTRDLVMRREMIISEGDQYSGTRINRSRDYIRRLGFFEDVQVREQARPGDPTVIDLQITVVERPTRSLQVGAGFSSADNFIATAQISENNLFGRGQSLTFNLQLSALRTIFVLSFFEPYLFDTRVQLGADVFKRSIVLSEFERDSQGFGITLGYRPFIQHDYWRDLSVTFGYNLESVRVIAGGTLGRASDVITRRFDGGLTSAISAALTLDRRDDRMFTRNGMYHVARAELAESVLGSENEFYRLTGISRFYTDLTFLPCADRARTPVQMQSEAFGDQVCRWLGNWTARANLEIGYVGPTNAQRDVPIFERYYVGGPTSVRGFERLSLSPSEPSGSRLSPDAITRDLLVGGYRQLLLNFELEFPVLTSLGLTGVLFADAGNAFEQDQSYSLRLDVFDPDGRNVLRTAAGFGVRWRSPIGPLRFEWGYPLAPRDDERRSVFEFSIQNAF